MAKFTLNSHKDLPIGVNKFLGPSHQQFCNRYLRRADGLIERQYISRWGKDGETVVMSAAEFDSWLVECASTSE